MTNKIEEDSKKVSRKDKKEIAKDDRKIRDDLKEKELDKIIKDGFPASDPPSTY